MVATGRGAQPPSCHSSHLGNTSASAISLFSFLRPSPDTGPMFESEFGRIFQWDLVVPTHWDYIGVGLKMHTVPLARTQVQYA